MVCAFCNAFEALRKNASVGAEVRDKGRRELEGYMAAGRHLAFSRGIKKFIFLRSMRWCAHSATRLLKRCART